MDIKKIVMNNGNVYEVLWDTEKVEGDFYSMIDIRKGWVKINRNYISEEFRVGKLKDKMLNPKIKKIVLDYFGEDIFLE